MLQYNHLFLQASIFFRPDFETEEAQDENTVETAQLSLDTGPVFNQIPKIALYFDWIDFESDVPYEKL